MTATITSIQPRALDALMPAIREIEQQPDYCLIIDSVTGKSCAHPRGCAIPAGWYRMSLRIKTNHPT